MGDISQSPPDPAIVNVIHLVDPKKTAKFLKKSSSN